MLLLVVQLCFKRFSSQDILFKIYQFIQIQLFYVQCTLIIFNGQGIVVIIGSFVLQVQHELYKDVGCQRLLWYLSYLFIVKATMIQSDIVIFSFLYSLNYQLKNITSIFSSSLIITLIITLKIEKKGWVYTFSYKIPHST